MKSNTLLIVIIAMIVVLSGCVTRKSCNRKFPPLEIDSVKEMVNTVTVYRDTLIYLEIKGDTVYVEKPVISGDTSALNTSVAQSQAWVENGILKHRLIQMDTIIDRIIKNAIRTSTTNQIKESKIQQTIEKDQKKWFENNLSTGIKSGLLIMLVLIFIAFMNCLKWLFK